MSHPWFHSVSSAKKHGGVPEDYLDLHSWFDQSKEQFADFRHRALRHHTHGIFEAERVFGTTIELSTCKRCGMIHDSEDPIPHAHEFEPKVVPTRILGEQHVQEDLGRIPTLADWLTKIAAEPWMNMSRRLSRELEKEDERSRETTS